jgi:hypothetical protein
MRCSTKPIRKAVPKNSYGVRPEAWGIPLTVYTLCVTVGGIARKPGVVRDGASRREERIEVREYLSLTLGMDYDVIDGAPAARFATPLKELIQGVPD